MYELPPILTGTQTQQLATLRAYLVRMATELNAAASAPTAYSTLAPAAVKGSARATAVASGASGTAADTDEVRKNAAALRQLIKNRRRTYRRHRSDKRGRAKLHGRADCHARRKLSCKVGVRDVYGEHRNPNCILGARRCGKLRLQRALRGKQGNP